METVSITAEREGITNGTAELQARLFAKVVAPFADQLTTAQPGEVYRAMIALLERALFDHALALTGGNQLRAARLLGVNRNTLRKRCRQLGLWPAAASSLPRALGASRTEAHRASGIPSD